MKKSKIYTRGGDAGTTSLIGGDRVKKCSLRLETYGTVDELSAHLGLLHSMAGATDSLIPWIQSRLFDIGTHLAMPCREHDEVSPCSIGEREVQRLENQIDEIDSQLPPLHAFILPGGTMAASQCHVCRTVCRRAERLIIALSEEAPVCPSVVAFIHRLSDLLFVYARYINKMEGVDEISWKNDCF